jgi:hypothetical protein
MLPDPCSLQSNSGAAAEEGFSDRHLGATSVSAIPERIKAFRQGLRELGYVEGKNVLARADGLIK